MVKISTLKTNPNNPRVIRDERFFKLVNNILLFSKFLAKRPIVHLDNVIQGGNMRFKALEFILTIEPTHFDARAQAAGLTKAQITEWNKLRKTRSIPEEWVADAAGFTQEEIEAFVIIDNADFGEWNMEQLANEWDASKLLDFGVELGGWASAINPEGNRLLDVDDEPTQGKTTRSPSATDEEYAMFEQVLLNAEKRELLEALNKVKASEGLEKLGDALMYIIRFYSSNHN